jgi:hypothetical protein
VNTSVLEARRVVARPSLRVSSVVVEIVAVAAIVVAAALVRWPDLMMVPRFTDESSEVMLGVRIARGEAFPLVNWHPHIGAAFNYLVAVSMLVVGPTIEAGRLVVWLLGALTAIPTYLLGRSIGGPVTGSLAALFLATSGTHIVLNSHIAYSDSLVPLFSTLSLWLVHQGINPLKGFLKARLRPPALSQRERGRERSGRWLAGGVAMLGVATQFHPSALVLAPAIGAYLLIHRRAVSLRWLLIGGAGAAVAVSNLVLSNLLNRLNGVTMALGTAGRYVDESGTWADRLLLLLRELPVGIAGVVTETARPEDLLQPVAIAFSALTVVGLVLLARRREWLPGLVAVAVIALISLLNGRLAPVVTRGRHYALILPVAYVCVAYALLAVHDRLIRITHRPGLVQTAMLLLVGALVLAPLVFVHRYYEEARAEGKTNQPVLRILDDIARDGHLDEHVYLDDQLQEIRTMSGGRILEHLQMGLAMRGQEYEAVDVKNLRLPLPRRPDASRILVLRADDVEMAESRYRLEALDADPSQDASPQIFRAFAHDGVEAGAGRR